MILKSCAHTHTLIHPCAYKLLQEKLYVCLQLNSLLYTYIERSATDTWIAIKEKKSASKRERRWQDRKLFLRNHARTYSLNFTPSHLSCIIKKCMKNKKIHRAEPWKGERKELEKKKKSVGWQTNEDFILYFAFNVVVFM